jgi:hypothetical protein
MDSVTQVLLGASIGVAVMGRRSALWKSALWGGVAGLLPDLFREGQGIVAEGMLVNGVFKADSVLAKHDENYMPREVADSLKKQGVWQDGGDGAKKN